MASRALITKEDLELDRNISLATEGITTNRFCELVLRDGNRLSKKNALTISEYIIAMKREINPRFNTIRTTIQFLYELSKCVGITKKFKEMTNKDILLYLDFENLHALVFPLPDRNTLLVALEKMEQDIPSISSGQPLMLDYFGVSLC